VYSKIKIIARMFCILIPVAIVTITCTYTGYTYKSIEAHKNFTKLTEEEQSIIKRVCRKIRSSEREEYYLNKLTELLETEYDGESNLVVNQNFEINKAVLKEKSRLIDNAGVNKEEDYEKTKTSNWKIMRSYEDEPYFYINVNGSEDILIKIKVSLVGDDADTAKIRYLEDAIEKHLSSPGFSVNLVFTKVLNSADDIFEIDVDFKTWPMSNSWAGGTHTIAHELMHVLGLPDEYDIVKVHSRNKNLPWKTRLLLFYNGIDQVIFDDAKYGIMQNQNKKPLHRHICKIVNMGAGCIANRKEIFKDHR